MLNESIAESYDDELIIFEAEGAEPLPDPEIAISCVIGNAGQSYNLIFSLLIFCITLKIAILIYLPPERASLNKTSFLPFAINASFAL